LLSFTFVRLAIIHLLATRLLYLSTFIITGKKECNGVVFMQK
jgi:hypothetical protein